MAIRAISTADDLDDTSWEVRSGLSLGICIYPILTMLFEDSMILGLRVSKKDASAHT
jgi:hypothetical protein